MTHPDVASVESNEELWHLVELRRWFHQHAELSFQEVETAEHIMNELDRLNLPYTYGGKGGGIIARQIAAEGMPTVALRAEMDALPGRETTGADYSSVHEGAMHACGHGAHMTMVLGAAARLKKSPPAGNVIYVFQPAEEYGGGSRKMISSGALKDVQAIFAGHVTHEFTTGRIMIAEGAVTSQSDRFIIEIVGHGGHGARPHEAIDAVVIAGFLIAAIQTLVSREINPMHPSVVTIGQVHAGSAANVIAEEARLEGSIRTNRAEVRRHIHSGLHRMGEAVGLLHNATVNVCIQEGYPPVLNTKAETAIARRAARRTVGEAGIADMEHPSMGSEDFSYYLAEVPGCFVRFGARMEDWEPVPLHSPGFDIDERVLLVGSKYFEQVVREFIAAG